MRRMAYLNCRNHGTNEPLCYGNGQENAERDLGVLWVCVCAAEETGIQRMRIHEKRIQESTEILILK